MNNYWPLLRGLNRDMRMYLLAHGLSGFTVDGGIYAVVLNLYLLRLRYGVQFIGALNGAGVLAYGLFILAARWLGSRFRTRRMIALGFRHTLAKSFWPGACSMWCQRIPLRAVAMPCLSKRR